MPAAAIARVIIEGLHGDTDLELRLNPRLSIVFGENGTGKTTVLHVLANIANGDLERFTRLRFQSLSVTNSSGDRLELRQEDVDERLLVVPRLNGRDMAAVSRGMPTQSDTRTRLRSFFGGRPVYLPAFRSVLEAVSRSRLSENPQTESQQREAQSIVESELDGTYGDAAGGVATSYLRRERARLMANKTILCRQWFGPFVPLVRFPSLWEVAEELRDELQRAKYSVAEHDRNAFTDVFVRALKAVVENQEAERPEALSAVVQRLQRRLADLKDADMALPEAYSELATLLSQQSLQYTTEGWIASRILDIYDRALEKRLIAQADAFEQLHTFERSANRFLSGKTLRAQREGDQTVRGQPLNPVELSGGRRAPLSVLSSGERHVLTLLFSATHMGAGDGLLLIDEPELSLHVNWQRTIIDELMKQAGDRQIVVATHAPEVTAEHRDSMVELVPRRT